MFNVSVIQNTQANRDRIFESCCGFLRKSLTSGPSPQGEGSGSRFCGGGKVSVRHRLRAGYDGRGMGEGASAWGVSAAGLRPFGHDDAFFKENLQQINQ